LISTQAASISGAKRAFDIVALIFLAPIAVPLAFFIAIGVFLDSPGPVIFRASRVGMGGRTFEMLKFRTMKVGVGGHAISSSGDHRITPVGRFLRATRLDELPQLWNVIRGQMSIVGPRPELQAFVDMHADDYREILAVPPGLTGPTQLRFAGVEARLLGMQEDPELYYREHLLPDKVALDLDYARSHSLRSDCLVLLETVTLPLILLLQRHPGADERSARPVAYAGALMAFIVLPLLFAMGLGSPR
jgi:lipopolysaccharide/colanic/teichoic acid biosynthesis glycosyltransferase